MLCECCKYDESDSDFLRTESIQANFEADEVAAKLKKRQDLALYRIDEEDAPFAEIDSESFEIEVWKISADNDNFGLELDLTNPLLPIVVRVVPDSQAVRWNFRAAPCKQLLPGLGLYKVNQVHQDAQKIHKELLQSKGSITLGFKWPSMQNVTLPRPPGLPLGLQMVLPEHEAAGLYLDRAEGLSASAGLRAGMHVRAVDGRRDSPERMKQEIEDASAMLTLRVASYV
mmetsp:Transcript_30939/g.72562  ORF Transcript_30939/g.72562 Transcript_30939/m.72562 type:complete len:229 (+) Transcript_30939:52-738(+)